MTVATVPRFPTFALATVLIFFLPSSADSCGAFHARQLSAIPTIFPPIDSQKPVNAPRDTTIPVLSWSTVERILSERSFVSGDELFQLLFILYNRERQLRFRMEKMQLSRLAGKITTFFPLAACYMVEVMDGRLILTFDDDQKIAVPNFWYQASLAVAKRLVLRIVEEEKVPAPSFKPAEAESDPDSKAIGFALEDGYLRLHFSFLIKLFDDKLRDAEVGILVYRINERTKTSRLELVELNSPAGNDLQPVAGTTTNRDGHDTVWIDIRHVVFPKTKDIGIADHRIFFPGTEIELLPDNVLHIRRPGTHEKPKALGLVH
ncbi:MAG: hypothetical protein V2B20_07465 [Pseudomonadota bacterium]